MPRLSDAQGLACPVCDSTAWTDLYARLGWRLVRCELCGLARLDPLPSEAELATHYSTRARRGGNYDLGRAPERQGNLSDALDFVEGLGVRSGTLLDVGCFDGGLMDLARGRGWEAWGLEPQDEPARAAEQRHPGRITHASVERAEGLPRRAFDVVTAIGVIEHLRDPGALLDLASTCLRPGGVLVIQTPDRRSFPARALGRYWPPVAPPEHTFYFDRRNLPRICRRHGLASLAMRRDVKRLRVQYVYDQFEFFGPELHRLLAPAMALAPRRMRNARLPFYGGEILFAARLSDAR
jgi:SAM-dependent methyltransferase